MNNFLSHLNFLSIEKNPRFKSLSILFAISIATLSISWSYADDMPLSGIFGNPYEFDVNFNGGNIGSVYFSGFIFHLDTTDAADIPTLDGKWIFLETVGWAQLENQTTQLTDDDISIPLATGSGVASMLLTGNVYLWSQNAGWLTLHSLDPKTYSGVSYNPGSRSFSGYAWSDSLGYLDFSSANMVFKNKVKILGNIGGNKAYDSEYYIGSKFNSVSVTGFLDIIRKNIALKTRGVADKPSPVTINNALYYKSEGGSIDDPGEIMSSKHIRSLIVEGGNIYINKDVPKDASVDSSRAIIAMKNKNGKGGNIYIGKNVKNIYTALVADGTIYSGENATTLYNDTKEKIINLPNNQLYIFGSVISRNTIGGATLSPNFSCPYTEGTCDESSSIKYDWNYFRTFDPSKKAFYGSDKSGFDDYSVIIEHDPRIISDPPPGFSK